MARTKALQPELKIEQIERALRRTNGLQTPAARMLNVTVSAISQRIKRSKRLQQVVEEIVEGMLDRAENVVHYHLEQNNLTGAIFYLKTKGKARGYIEGQEIDLQGEVGITKIERVIVDVSPKAAEIEHTTQDNTSD
jgi:hypothetical protein